MLGLVQFTLLTLRISAALLLQKADPAAAAAPPPDPMGRYQADLEKA